MARRCSQWLSAIFAARVLRSELRFPTPTDVPTGCGSPTSSASRRLLTVLRAMFTSVQDACAPTRSSALCNHTPTNSQADHRKMVCFSFSPPLPNADGTIQKSGPPWRSAFAQYWDSKFRQRRGNPHWYAECFHETDIFIKHGHHPALGRGRQIAGQGPHMAQNDILFHRRQVKILPGVLQRLAGVLKAVEQFALGRAVSMPVIQEQVVQKPAPGRCPGVQSPVPAIAIAEIGHVDTVVQAAGGAVLHKLRHGLHRFMLPQVGNGSAVLGILGQPYAQCCSSFSISSPPRYSRRAFLALTMKSTR